MIVAPVEKEREIKGGARGSVPLIYESKMRDCNCKFEWCI